MRTAHPAPQLQDRQWLVGRYHDERKSAAEIGREIGCSKPTVLKAFRVLGIEPRNCGPRPAIQPGQRFGRLVVLRQEGRDDRNRLYVAACDCGGEAIVPGGNLTSGNTACCGCERRGRHGHGSHEDRTYNSWRAMRERCGNPNSKVFKYYGGRGIIVCGRWRDSFANFLTDVGERPAGMTLDRIDPDGNYEPGNVRWATAKTQRLNQRT